MGANVDRVPLPLAPTLEQDDADHHPLDIHRERPIVDERSASFACAPLGSAENLRLGGVVFRLSDCTAVHEIGELGQFVGGSTGRCGLLDVALERFLDDDRQSR